MVDIFSSALPEPEPFGCRIARRSCFEHLQCSFRMPSVSLPTPNGCRNERTMSGRNIASYRQAGVDVRLCQIGNIFRVAMRRAEWSPKLPSRRC
jgi:hypothetical protein